MGNEVGDLLNEIGSLLAEDKAHPIEGTFLYVEAEWQVVGISIFKDLGDHLLYQDPMDGLSDVLLELWEAEVPEKRWTAMEYRIEGGRFRASFNYDLLDSEKSMLERREVILRRSYGNKIIDYPPLI